MSDDGRQALTLIAFIGSVFSPYYAAARRRGPTDPREHVALNVALYGDGPRRWAMTERGRGRLQHDADTLRIGPSALAWDGDALVVTLDEIATPLPRRVRGTLRVDGLLPGFAPLALDAAAAHRWQPIAPRARIRVDLTAPSSCWQGDAYLDSNWGDEPLARAFRSWQWSRTALPDGGCLVHYDTVQRDSQVRAMALTMDRDGHVDVRRGELAQPLLRSRWGIPREAHGGATLRATLEDGPFYTRSLLATPWQGRTLATMHESLSLDRFERLWVQAMLPFRMPRRA